MKALPDAAIASLEQIRFVIGEVTHYENRHQLDLYAGSGIGKHVRHILDHYLAVRQGLDQAFVDYNQRHRDSEMETVPDAALHVIGQLHDWLQGLNDLEHGLRIRSEVSCRAEYHTECDSNLGRELLYLINHTIHHAAYIKRMVEESDLRLPEEIGLAPCTATYRRALATDLHEN